MICLLHALSNTSPVSSTASPCEGFHLLLAQVLSILKLSLDECTEFIIVGLISIMVHGLLSFHHFEKFGNLLLQHLQQHQQQKQRITMARMVVTTPKYDRKDCSCHILIV
jgi:hypothetical protein